MYNVQSDPNIPTPLILQQQPFYQLPQRLVEHMGIQTSVMWPNLFNPSLP
jgi:hypothetical protein